MPPARFRDWRRKDGNRRDGRRKGSRKDRNRKDESRKDTSRIAGSRRDETRKDEKGRTKKAREHEGQLQDSTNPLSRQASSGIEVFTGCSFPSEFLSDIRIIFRHIRTLLWTGTSSGTRSSRPAAWRNGPYGIRNYRMRIRLTGPPASKGDRGARQTGWRGGADQRPAQ